MKWDKPHILQALKKMYRSGESLSYSSLSKRHQSLVSAAAYHFGSYRNAVEKAGIDYSQIVQRPRWTKKRIIAVIKRAKRAGHDLHWGAVTRGRDELARAAFAAVQPRLFGRWDRALHAAGLDADDVARYRTWDRNTVAFELRLRASDHEPLSSGLLQRDDPGLHAAAVRYFGSYDKALRAARLDPSTVRLRKAWTPTRVIKALRKYAREGGSLSDSSIRTQAPALYGAAVRLFKTFTAARRAAKLKLSRKSNGRVR